MSKPVMVVTLLLVTTGCGDVSITPTLDTSSEDALLLSIEAIEESLEGDEEKLEQFFGSIVVLQEIRGEKSSHDWSLYELVQDLHGATVDEIIAKADEELKMDSERLSPRR